MSSGSASGQANRLDLPPSGAELGRVFSLPVLCVVIGAGFLAMGLVPAGGWLNGATVLGIGLTLLSLVLIGLEWHDLERSWLAWDDAGLTLARRRHPVLRLAWADIADVRVHEILTGGRLLPGPHRVFVTLRPVSLRAVEAAHDCAAYVDTRFGDDELGLPASEGVGRRQYLDAAFRARGMPHYRGVTTSLVESPRGRLRGLVPARPTATPGRPGAPARR